MSGTPARRRTPALLSSFLPRLPFVHHPVSVPPDLRVSASHARVSRSSARANDAYATSSKRTKRASSGRSWARR